MPTIVNVAIRPEKVIEFLMQAGFAPDSIANFKPTKEDLKSSNHEEKECGG